MLGGGREMVMCAVVSVMFVRGFGRWREKVMCATLNLGFLTCWWVGEKG
jgi:hypothetical protein